MVKILGNPMDTLTGLLRVCVPRLHKWWPVQSVQQNDTILFRPLPVTGVVYALSMAIEVTRVLSHVEVTWSGKKKFKYICE